MSYNNSRTVFDFPNGSTSLLLGINSCFTAYALFSRGSPVGWFPIKFCGLWFELIVVSFSFADSVSIRAGRYGQTLPSQYFKYHDNDMYINLMFPLNSRKNVYTKITTDQKPGN